MTFLFPRGILLGFGVRLTSLGNSCLAKILSKPESSEFSPSNRISINAIQCSFPSLQNTNNMAFIWEGIFMPLNNCYIAVPFLHCKNITEQHLAWSWTSNRCTANEWTNEQIDVLETPQILCMILKLMASYCTVIFIFSDINHTLNSLCSHWPLTKLTTHDETKVYQDVIQYTAACIKTVLLNEKGRKCWEGNIFLYPARFL